MTVYGLYEVRGDENLDVTLEGLELESSSKSHSTTTMSV